MKLIDGKKLAADIRSELREKVEKMTVKPCLAVILVGEDPASISYVTAKEKACAELGIISKMVRLPAETSESDLVSLVESLNEDDSVSGILVQLPLPKHIDKNKVIDAISQKKDVDGFTPENIGKMLLGRYDEAFIPCTPAGIIKLVEKADLNLIGKKVTVIGRSDIVGRPAANLLTSKLCNATVVWCHSKTPSSIVEEACKSSDCIVVACGKRDVIPYSWIKDDAVVIDVGVNRIPDASKKSGFRLVGDVYDSADAGELQWLEQRNISITPVPGGVGPMTIAMLMSNTVHAANRK